MSAADVARPGNFPLARKLEMPMPNEGQDIAKGRSELLGSSEKIGDFDGAFQRHRKLNDLGVEADGGSAVKQQARILGDIASDMALSTQAQSRGKGAADLLANKIHVRNDVEPLNLAVISDAIGDPRAIPIRHDVIEIELFHFSIHVPKKHRGRAIHNGFDVVIDELHEQKVRVQSVLMEKNPIGLRIDKTPADPSFRSRLQRTSCARFFRWLPSRAAIGETYAGVVMCKPLMSGSPSTSGEVES